MSKREEEEEENAGKIRDEIEALKAIYNINDDDDDEMIDHRGGCGEEKEDENATTNNAVVVVKIREEETEVDKESEGKKTNAFRVSVNFGTKSRLVLCMDAAAYPSRAPFAIEEMKTPDNFDWDFEKLVRKTKDAMHENEVFAFEFIEKYKEMFEREEAEAKRREEKEREENERSARERREKQKRMSEEDAKTKAAIFKDHLVSWKHEGDPNVTPLLETELADDVRKRFKSHDIVCFEKCRFQAHTVTDVQTIKEIKIALKLILLDPKVQTATHPRIFAYRIPNDDDFNDDGETGAGKNLANVLRLRGSENVFVAVTRWFGGTHLGPQRFKVINSCASAALESVGAKGFEKK